MASREMFVSITDLPRFREHLDSMDALLDDLTDPDPCQYDHHDLCQAHRLDPRPCPHERANHYLRSIGLRPPDAP